MKLDRKVYLEQQKFHLFSCWCLLFEGTTKCHFESLLLMQAKHLRTSRFAHQFHSSSTRKIEETGAKSNQEVSVKPHQETLYSFDSDLVKTKGIS